MIITTLILILTNFFAVFFAIKKIIYISHRKNLFDEPTELRKIHLNKTPNLGGIGIFATFFLSGCFFYSGSPVINLNFAIAAAIILFGLGLTDDLLGVDPLKKFLTQLFVAVLLTSATSLHLDRGLVSILGIIHIPYFPSILLSSFLVLFLMNAMNLIDGINGLAGSLTLLSCVVFSLLFWKLHDPFFFQLTVALGACIAGFLYFNFSPAKIFMGDTGSLFVGFMLSVFSIRLLEADFTPVLSMGVFIPKSAPVLVLALLIIPIYDTVRVFTLRLLKKKSPFEADRNHIHHMLLDLGLSHTRATATLLTANLFVLILAAALSNMNPLINCVLIVAFTGSLFSLASYLKKQKLSAIPSFPERRFKTGKIRTFTVLNSGNISHKKVSPVIKEGSGNHLL